MANPTSSSPTGPPGGSAGIPRASQELPPKPRDQAASSRRRLGMLLKMMQDSRRGSARQRSSTISPAFSVAGPEHLRSRGGQTDQRAPELLGEEIERLHKSLGEVKVMAPRPRRGSHRRRLIVAGLKRRFIGGQYFLARALRRLSRKSLRRRVRYRYGGDLPLEERPRFCASPIASRCNTSPGLRHQRGRVRAQLKTTV